jgi:hypothetical protein
LQEEKAQKLLMLNARIEEVIAGKMCLINEKREMMNMKMAKAELKRQEHIDGIRKKAREEVKSFYHYYFHWRTIRYFKSTNKNYFQMDQLPNWLKIKKCYICYNLAKYFLDLISFCGKFVAKIVSKIDFRVDTGSRI